MRGHETVRGYQAAGQYEAVKFDQEENFTKMFLELPKRLYASQELMQNEAEEQKILSGTHPLSRYFTIHKFLVLDKARHQAAARAILTLYPNDSQAYIGYFECEADLNNEEQAQSYDGIPAAQCLFETVFSWARENGYRKITGPVNASFWLGYRLKMDRFGKPYTGEPYNKAYYKALFTGAGFRVRDEYKSNRFSIISEEFSDPKFAKRLEQKRAEGYEIRSPRRGEFDAALRECYGLIIRLYSDFPVFKPIDEETFIANYSYLKYIVDYRMIKLAYFHGVMKGFFISIPNYGSCFGGALTFSKILKALRCRFFPKDYVMLYMGVDEEHHGLGKALAEAIMRELKRKKASSVGALIHGDKVNGRYFDRLIEYEYHYALMEAELL